ncbi:MAG: hypothetical protein GWM90_30465 [Gemmatimonadetes bacterium]|nr:hypothetical protein [Gemmatimonadota bacterium]NIQ59478.1 hypothetical protein [Gemmatimonadota bacterium]NIU79673.1 hypothetical protein [Gammaproteobacteria bacterium]NIX48229.1 hypothetical protein [Gemmatimonadota bacterium]NIY12665.1 hypothetical protein [Gemmatimonadota bacterium]
MSRPDRAAHHAYEKRHREVDVRLRRRVTEIADAMDLAPSVRQAFLVACERAAHLHTADCALVDHEYRTGRSLPAEDEAAREAIQEREWVASMTRLNEALAEAREAEAAAAAEAAGAPAEEPERRYQVHYQPLASLTRRPDEE